MKISKLISIFEKCISTYQKCVDEKWEINKLWEYELTDGICTYCDNAFNIDTSKLFKTYYKNFLDSRGLLFPTMIDFSHISYKSHKEKIDETLLPRLNFMKEQVKELKKLQKQGYTHV